MKRSDLEWGMRMAITYRIERLKILDNQRMVLRLCRDVVIRSADAYRSGKFRELVMAQTPDELRLEESYPGLLETLQR